MKRLGHKSGNVCSGTLPCRRRSDTSGANRSCRRVFSRAGGKYTAKIKTYGPHLFEVAAAIMAEAGRGSTKIAWRQIRDAGLSSTPFDRIPNYVGGHTSFPSLSLL